MAKQEADFMAEIEQRTRLAFTNQMEMLTFYLSDSQQYGINVFKIIEVIETPKTITKVPQSHPSIVGAINFREKLVTVIDLSKALRLEPVDFRHSLSYIIICEYSNSTQGFMVTRPNKLLNKSWEDIKTPSRSFQQDGYLTAITYDDDGQSIQILDVEKILGEIIGIDNQVDETLIKEGQSHRIENFHVLAVDDSRAARVLLDNSLTQLGVKHELYEDAQKALDALKASMRPESTRRFCLIISDIEMPGMDGFTFTRTVKADPELARIHLVLHSSMSNQANQVKAQQVGADAFIAKFQPDEIARVVLDQIKKAEANPDCR
ncbi:MAG: chemotaxis protein CheV [Magnetococcales bacterium]|nr:chemotaxis protein CheV [Magnetococcales bacterium]